MECHLPLGRMRSSKVALNVPAGSMAPVSASLLAPFLTTPRTLLTVLIMAPSNLATSRWELNIPWNHTVWTTSRWTCPEIMQRDALQNQPPSARRWTHPEIIQTDTLQNQPGYEHTLKSYRETPFKISHHLPEDEHTLKSYRQTPFKISQDMNTPWNHTERHPSKSATICQKMNTPWNHAERCPSKRDTLQNQPPSARRWTHPEIIQTDTLQNQPGYEHTLKSYRETPFKISEDMNTPWNHKERRLSNQPPSARRWTCPEIVQRCPSKSATIMMPGDEHALKLYRETPFKISHRQPDEHALGSYRETPFKINHHQPGDEHALKSWRRMPFKINNLQPGDEHGLKSDRHSDLVTFSWELNTD